MVLFRLMGVFALLHLSTTSLAFAQDFGEKLIPAAKQLLSAEVANLPFLVKHSLLLRFEPEYAKLTPKQAGDFLRAAEREHAASTGHKPKDFVIWSESCAACGHFYIAGERYLTLQNGPLTLGLKLGQFEKFADAYLFVALDATADVGVDLLPSNVSLISVDPKFFVHKAADLKSVAKAVQHGASWKSGLVAGLGGLATTNTTASHRGSQSGDYNSTSGDSGTYSGTYSGTTTITQPDYAARERSRERAAQIKSAADDRSNLVMNTALVSTTALPGSSYGGHIYFEKVKGEGLKVFRVLLGSTSFEFPIR